MNSSCKGRHIFQKWEDFGWDVGKISLYFPRGTKYNFEITWTDGKRDTWLHEDRWGPVEGEVTAADGSDTRPDGAWVLLSLSD